MIKHFFSLLAAKILLVQTTLILTVIYFLVLGPIAILAKISFRDFLKTSAIRGTFWRPRRSIQIDLKQARKQY